MKLLSRLILLALLLLPGATRGQLLFNNHGQDGVLYNTHGQTALLYNNRSQIASQVVAMNFAVATYSVGQPSLPYYRDSLITTTRAQTGAGIAPTSYATDTSGNLQAFAANAPRITNQGLLVEAAATNLFPGSNFTAGWGPNRVTLTAGAVTSPDNTSDAAAIVEDTSATIQHELLSSTLTVSASTTYTTSVYVAQSSTGSPRNLELYIFDSLGNTAVAQLILAAGYVFNATCTGITCGPAKSSPASNNFTRYYITYTTSSSTSLTTRLYLMKPDTNGTDAGSITYTGDGVSGVSAFCFQTEAGTQPTSCVPTTTAAATRNADVVQAIGPLATALNVATGSVEVTAAGGMGYGFAGTLIDSNGTPLLGYTAANVLTDGLVATLSTANVANRLSPGKDQAVIAWSPAGRTLALNGGASVSDANAQTPSATSYIGSSSGTSNPCNCYIASINVWNTAVPVPQNVIKLVSGKPLFGLAMDGLEWSPASSSYRVPSAADWSYFAQIGIKTARLPVAWENLQPALNGPLNSSFVSIVLAQLALANANGISVIVDLHNFAHYCLSSAWGVSAFIGGNEGTTTTGCPYLGASNLPATDLTQFWGLFAAALVGQPGLGGYEFMNEPANINTGTGTWGGEVPVLISTVDAIDTTATPYYIMGPEEFGDWWTWANVSGFPFTSATHSLIYDSHFYFDAGQCIGGSSNYSGTYASYNIDNETGVCSVGPFLAWGKANNIKLAILEFNYPIGQIAVDANAQWVNVAALFEAVLAQAGTNLVQVATMWFYRDGDAGNLLDVAPTGSAVDARILQMQGNW
jgi:hypothetical protein